MNIRTRQYSSISRSFFLGVLCTFFFGGVQAQSPLAAQLEIFQVQQLMSAGQVFEQLSEVESVSPGTLLEYVLTYRNVSDQLLAGFDIQSPVPVNTFYLAGTAELAAEHQFQVSLDGGATWLDTPAMQSRLDEQGMELLEPIPTQTYTDLRWRITSVLAPEQQVQIRYRVEVR